MTEYKIIFYGLLGALLLGVLFLELVVRKRALAAGRGVSFSPDESRLQIFWTLGLLLCFALVFASRPRESTGRPMYYKKKVYPAINKTPSSPLPAFDAAGSKTGPSGP